MNDRLKIGILIAAAGLGGCQPEQTTHDSADETPQQALTPAAGNEAPGAFAARVERRSQYTSIDSARCKLLEENVEEGGWSRELCDGLAGYRLEVTESDLRQDITIISASGRRTELGLTEIVAKGAFNALGKTAEWRGSDIARPDALILRLGVAADPEARKPDVSHLVIVRLKPAPCIVSIVPPGPGQNERARTIADGKLSKCLER